MTKALLLIGALAFSASGALACDYHQTHSAEAKTDKITVASTTAEAVPMTTPEKPVTSKVVPPKKTAEEPAQ